MPELPEIEHLRRTLAPWLIGARVVSVDLRRRGVVRVAGSRKARRGVTNLDLLEGCVIRDIVRRGKSLAILGDNGRVLALHMGMTGSMRIVRDKRDGEMERRRDKVGSRDKHVHCEWMMEGEQQSSEARGQRSAMRTSDARIQRPAPRFRLLFRDPRRFGGLWPFASLAELHTHAGGWARLGPDAFEPPLDSTTLRARLLRAKQPMKATLLNQKLIAGVGNIYADEALFAAGIHPLMRPQCLHDDDWRRLTKALHDVLAHAVKAGGSTIRDYADADGEAGWFVNQHQVYGRGGEACFTCGNRLKESVIGQRTTVHCPACQPSQRMRHPRVVHTRPQ